MALKRGSSNAAVHHRGRIGNYRVPVVSLLVISVLAPLLFLAARAGNFKSVTGGKNFLHGQTGMGEALEQGRLQWAMQRGVYK